MQRRPRPPSFYPPREKEAQPASFYAGKGKAVHEPPPPAGVAREQKPARPPKPPPPPRPAGYIAPWWHAILIFALLIACLLAYRNSFKSGWVLDNLYIIKYDPRTKADNWDDTIGQPGVKQIFQQ